MLQPDYPDSDQQDWTTVVVGFVVAMVLVAAVVAMALVLVLWWLIA